MSKTTKYVLTSLSIISAIIIIGATIAFSFYEATVIGEKSESFIGAGKYEIETNIDSVDPLNVKMQLLTEEEIATKSFKLDFDVKSLAKTDDKGKFNVLLKDVEISKNIESKYLKWDLFMDGNLIETGDFENVAFNNIKNDEKSTSLNDSFDYVHIKDGISFGDNDTHNLSLRVYLLNDNLVDQTNLMNGILKCKINVEGYK